MKRKLLEFSGNVKANRVLAFTFLYLTFAFFMLSLQHQAKINNFGINHWMLLCAFSLTISISAFLNVEDIKAIVIVFTVMGAVIAFTGPVFNLLDEKGHMDFVNYIVQKGALPNVNDNYEAFQPPLYYLLCASLTFFIKNDILMLNTLRIINLLLMLACIIISIKILVLLTDKKIISDDKKIIYGVPTIFTFFTAFLYRSAFAGNEILSALFTFMIVYLLCKIVLEDNNCKREYIYSSILILAAVMTKLSNIYLFVPFVGVMLYKKKYKKIVFAALIIFIGSLPWFISNILRYGALTGTQEHMNYVLPIVNPSGYDYSIKNIFLFAKDFFAYYFCTQEFFPDLRGSLVTLCKALNMFMIIFTLLAFIRLFFYGIQFIIKKCRFEYTIPEKKKVIEMIASAMLFCLIAGLLLATYKANIIYIAARYLMSANIAFMILFSIYINRLPKILKYLFGITLMFFTSIFTIYNFHVAVFEFIPLTFKK